MGQCKCQRWYFLSILIQRMIEFSCWGAVTSGYAQSTKNLQSILGLPGSVSPRMMGTAAHGSTALGINVFWVESRHAQKRAWRLCMVPIRFDVWNISVSDTWMIPETQSTYQGTAPLSVSNTKTRWLMRDNKKLPTRKSSVAFQAASSKTLPIPHFFSSEMTMPCSRRHNLDFRQTGWR